MSSRLRKVLGWGAGLRKGRAVALFALTVGLSTVAFAAPYTVQISEVEINNNGLFVDASGNPQPAIFVRGTFTPTLPCAQQGFFLYANDPFLPETVAVLLAAKATGSPVGFTFIYCTTNGYARGGTFSIQ